MLICYLFSTSTLEAAFFLFLFHISLTCGIYRLYTAFTQDTVLLGVSAHGRISFVRVWASPRKAFYTWVSGPMVRLSGLDFSLRQPGHLRRTFDLQKAVQGIGGGTQKLNKALGVFLFIFSSLLQCFFGVDHWGVGQRVRTRSNSVGETFGNQLAQYFQLWWVMDLWTFRQKSEAHSSKLSCTTYRHHGQKCISAKRADFETFTCSLCIYTKLKMTKKMLKFNNQIFINSHAKWPTY